MWDLATRRSLRRGQHSVFAVYATEPEPDDPMTSLAIGERRQPEAPEGWTAVRVRAASLNGRALRGVGVRHDKYPMILGCDAAGVLDDGTGDADWRGDKTFDPRRSMLGEVGRAENLSAGSSR